MARVLCVGIASVDIINLVDGYPAEDTEVRAVAQQVRCGGNAANTAMVLAQLGIEAHWAGNLGDRSGTHVIRRAMAAQGVDLSRAVEVAGGFQPTSYITLNRQNGSRSIVHYRDLPEYAADAFLQIDLRGFDWVHFEGRAIPQLAPMLDRVRGMCGIPISLEVEKPRAGIEPLFAEADLLLFSRDYALSQGFNDAQALLADLPSGGVATCTWGDRGAWARDSEGRVLHQPAVSPLQVVDTIGAGDVFNAAMINAMCRAIPVGEALRQANRLAGRQCAREGLELSDE